jgi:hypothetical protein
LNSSKTNNIIRTFTQLSNNANTFTTLHDLESPPARPHDGTQLLKHRNTRAKDREEAANGPALARNYNQPLGKASPAPPSKPPAADSAKKAQTGIPWHRTYTPLSGNSPANPSRSPNAVDVYYLDGGTKTLLGVASDKVKLARFSTTASLQLKVKRGRFAEEEVYSTADDGDRKLEILLELPIDYEAVLLILRWINGNSIYVAKPLIYGVPPAFSFGFYCKIHAATRVFRIRREMQGSRVREILEEYIGGLQQPGFDDFRTANEELEFDPPLIYLMRSQVVSVHLVEGLAEGEYDRIMEYCEAQSEKLLGEMKAIEAEIRLGLGGEQAGLEEAPFVVNKSVEEETLAAAASKLTIAKREKVRLGFRKVGEKKPEETKTEEAKPSQEVVATKFGKVSYAEALRF